MNRNYKFGTSSMKHLSTVAIPLRLVCMNAQQLANHANSSIYIPDWGYSCGLRTAKEQAKLYTIGRTKEGSIVTNADGYINLSKHQSGNAIDMFAYVDGKASYKQEHLSVIAALHLQAAMELGVSLEWGGLFNSVNDSPHIELHGV